MQWRTYKRASHTSAKLLLVSCSITMTIIGSVRTELSGQWNECRPTTEAKLIFIRKSSSMPAREAQPGASSPTAASADEECRPMTDANWLMSFNSAFEATSSSSGRSAFNRPPARWERGASRLQPAPRFIFTSIFRPLDSFTWKSISQRILSALVRFTDQKSSLSYSSKWSCLKNQWQLNRQGK